VGFFSSLFQNSGSGLQGLTGYPRYYDEDHKRRAIEDYGTGVRERTNLDPIQTGRSAEQINKNPGFTGDRRRGGFFGPSFFGERKTNNPVEVAGLGNLVSDSDGSMYGTDSSPALADYMLPQPKYKDMTSTLQEQGQTLKEDEAIVQQDIPSSYPEKQQVVQQEAHPKGWLSKIFSGEPITEEQFQENQRMAEAITALLEQSQSIQSEPTSGKLNENISGNIYAKHGGSLFRNAYDQASNIMYRAKGGGLEGLKESIDINGQPHNLAYINPTEANLLKVLGGTGQKVNGIPAYWAGGEAGWDAGWTGDDDAAPGEGEDPEGDVAYMGPEAANALGPGVGHGDMPFAEDKNSPLSLQSYKESLGRDHQAFIGDPEGKDAARAKFGPGVYAQDAFDRALGKLGRDGLASLTQSEIDDYYDDAQHAHYQVAFHHPDKTAKEQSAIAITLANEYEKSANFEITRDDAEFVLATGGMTLGEMNAAKQALANRIEFEQQKVEDNLLKQADDYYTNKEMDKEEFLELNEDYLELAQKAATNQAVIDAIQDTPGMSDFIGIEQELAMTQVSQRAIDMLMGRIDKDWSYLAGQSIKVGLVGMLRGITSPLDSIISLVHAIGNLIGEGVLGSVDVNGIRMNVHESGNITFQSPEDAPGYDDSGEGEGGGPVPKKNYFKPLLEEEEDLKEQLTSIADLVPKKDSSGTGRDYSLDLYQSIYGPDATYKSV